jgi:hypothetical protein
VTGRGQRKERILQDGQNWSMGSKVIRKKRVATDQNPGFVSISSITFERISIFLRVGLRISFFFTYFKKSNPILFTINLYCEKGAGYSEHGKDDEHGEPIQGVKEM